MIKAILILLYKLIGIILIVSFCFFVIIPLLLSAGTLAFIFGILSLLIIPIPGIFYIVRSIKQFLNKLQNNEKF